VRQAINGDVDVISNTRRAPKNIISLTIQLRRCTAHRFVQALHLKPRH